MFISIDIYNLIFEMKTQCVDKTIHNVVMINILDPWHTNWILHANVFHIFLQLIFRVFLQLNYSLSLLTLCLHLIICSMCKNVIHWRSTRYCNNNIVLWKQRRECDNESERSELYINEFIDKWCSWTTESESNALLVISIVGYFLFSYTNNLFNIVMMSVKVILKEFNLA